MVFNYDRKTTGGNGWTEESIRMAVEVVKKDNKSIRETARHFNIPYPTLRKLLIKDSTAKKLGRFEDVFTAKQEEMLVEYIKRMDDIFFGVDKEDLGTLAFEFAERNKIKHPFKGNRAGEQWIYNFRNRHSNLSPRSPESTSVGRARGFNREQVDRFFKNLEELMEKYKFDKNMMWNVDESVKKETVNVGTVCRKRKLFLEKNPVEKS